MLCTKVSEFIGETTNALCNFTSTIKKNFFTVYACWFK